ncbi:Putative phospholipase A1 [Ferriphaselus amnicola]|uniref:Phospholipase A1 n=1 Tax=Ferriphaselus amnicola TaxID=1188319 RepID=A0A2Z6GEQ3_9PROT|nr:phospholipase A [Ferriphaselus amnicola]BBE52076.1 Putative phospholipase A1 [Ferriphaselus amnicola]
MYRKSSVTLLAAVAAFGLGIAADVFASEASFLQCAKQQDAAERLKCYDHAAARQPQAEPATVEITPPLVVNVPAETLPSIEAPAAPAITPTVAARSYLTRVWNLDGQGDNDEITRAGRLRPHHQSYLLLRRSSHVNNLPFSPSPGHQVTTGLPLDLTEAKFQFSFKSEIAGKHDFNWLGFDDLHIWAGYTQQSNWQALNAPSSSAFRETNYEPEIIASLSTNNSNGLKLVNLGFNHQSNGQGQPLSRSWNRVYLQGGWEWDVFGKFSLLTRGWWRVPENPAKDDNPDIQSFLGRGDIVAHWEPSSQQSVTLLMRNNLNVHNNRGFIQLDWATPFMIGKMGKAHVQITEGYGESMVDYNFHQNTIGIGVSFRDW